MKRSLAWALAVLGGIGVFWVVMQPTPAERLSMAGIFALMAFAAAAGSYWLPQQARRTKSLRTTLTAVSLFSFAIVVFGLLAAGQQMFISTHDLALMLVVIGFGVVAAIAFALTVSGPLTVEVARIARAASTIAAGDFSARTGVDREDEVGELASSVDRMAETLEEADLALSREDANRRRLFTAVGHDLRTPLASMKAALEAIQDGVATDTTRYLDSMRRDTQALSRLVDDLFLLARLESGDVAHRVEHVDLTELADEAVELIRPLCDKRGLVVRLEMDRRVIALASTEGIARVLRNLLDNAVRHSPEGGEIVVTVSNGAEARVEVTDDGPGFPAEFVSQAFETSSRNHGDRSRSSGGSGLGLAIAHRYIEDFGGSIWADTGPGGRVAFLLPASAS